MKRIVSFPKCWLRIESNLLLAKVAEMVSAIFMINLVLDSSGRFEEVETYYGEVLGLAIYVFQEGIEGGKNLYHLNIHPRPGIATPDFEEIDISSYIEFILGEALGLTVSAWHSGNDE